MFSKIVIVIMIVTERSDIFQRPLAKHAKKRKERKQTWIPLRPGLRQDKLNRMDRICIKKERGHSCLLRREEGPRKRGLGCPQAVGGGLSPDYFEAVWKIWG